MYVAWSLCEQTGISGSRTGTLESTPNRSAKLSDFRDDEIMGVGLGLDINISTFYSSN